ILLAVSKTSDPTQGWKGLDINSDPEGMRWADFDMLGMDGDTVYVTANMFPIASASLNASVFILPKADLLQPSPSAANLELLPHSLSTIGFSAQPAVRMDNAGAQGVMISAYSSNLIFSQVFGDPGSHYVD